MSSRTRKIKRRAAQRHKMEVGALERKTVNSADDCVDIKNANTVVAKEEKGEPLLNVAEIARRYNHCVNKYDGTCWCVKQYTSEEGIRNQLKNAGVKDVSREYISLADFKDLLTHTMKLKTTAYATYKATLLSGVLYSFGLDVCHKYLYLFANVNVYEFNWSSLLKKHPYENKSGKPGIIFKAAPSTSAAPMEIKMKEVKKETAVEEPKAEPAHGQVIPMAKAAKEEYSMENLRIQVSNLRVQANNLDSFVKGYEKKLDHKKLEKANTKPKTAEELKASIRADYEAFGDRNAADMFLLELMREK